MGRQIRELLVIPGCGCDMIRGCGIRGKRAEQLHDSISLDAKACHCADRLNRR